MLNRLPGVPLATEQDGVRTRWGTGSQLVEGDRLTTSSEDALPGGLSEPQRGNGHLGDDGETDVVSHGSDLDDDLGCAVDFGGLGGKARKGERGAVGFGEEETVEDDLWRFGDTFSTRLRRVVSAEKTDLVEGGIGTSRQETVELKIRLCSAQVIKCTSWCIGRTFTRSSK